MSKEAQLHEFPAVGKYRVRIVRDLESKAPASLDIREFVNPARGQTFSGFTRRGIRLATTKEIMELRGSLNAALSMLEVKS